jgi:hypothetical protein
MAGEELREKLARLHAELQRSSTLDQESQRRVMQVSADIARQSQAGAAPEPDHVSKLQELAVRFESGHPALAASVRELMGLLGGTGV